MRIFTDILTLSLSKGKAEKQKGRSFWLRPLNFLPELGRSSAVTFFYGFA
jgi:hypothetical protein